MPFTELKQGWVLPVGAVVVYLLVMFFNPARASLRDGIRCMRRYGTLWRTLVVFGLCYAIFQIAVEVFYYYILPEGNRPIFQWSRPWFLTDETLKTILKDSRLPALEGVAGIFNVLITTFPFSAIAALMFLANWDGHHVVLARALRRRFGAPGWIIHFGIIICAVAAIANVFLYGPLLLVLNNFLPGLRLLQCSLVVNWLSFLFEIMFGVCVQIYLILMVYAWVGGLSFTRQHLLDFAIRRFSFVMKWSAIVMFISTVLINMPLILSNVPPFSHFIPADDLVPRYVDPIARPILVAFLFLFSGIQIILTFHSESLRKAMRDYFHFLRKDALSIGCFLLVAVVHFYILNVVNGIVNAGFASNEGVTAVTVVWRLFYPLLAAFVSGWLLASWVCLYKRSEAGRVHAGDWIKY